MNNYFLPVNFHQNRVVVRTAEVDTLARCHRLGLSAGVAGPAEYPPLPHSDAAGALLAASSVTNRCLSFYAIHIAWLRFFRMSSLPF